MRLDPVCSEPEDFHALGSPFTSAVLFCGNPNFLSGGKAIRVAFALLARQYIRSKDNLCVGNLDSTEHVVSSLDVNPPAHEGLIQRWINDAPLKGSISSPEGGTQEAEQIQGGNEPVAHPM